MFGHGLLVAMGAAYAQMKVQKTERLNRKTKETRRKLEKMKKTE
jgi:hypothetical protein